MHKNQHENFAPEKQQKRGKRTRFSQKKAKPGCVLGAGGGGSGWERIKLGAKSQSLNQKRTPFPCTTCKKKPRQKHSVSAGFVAGAEGLEPSARGFGVDVETAHRERGRDKVAPFYQPSHKTGRCWFGAVRKNEWIERASVHLSQNDCFYLRFVL